MAASSFHKWSISTLAFKQRINYHICQSLRRSSSSIGKERDFATEMKLLKEKSERAKLEYLIESEKTSKILLHGVPRTDQYKCLSLQLFTAKLESFFKAYNIEYEAALDGGIFMRSTCHNKIPFISYKGKEYGDSQLIMDMLCKERNININNNLSEKEIAISNAFRTAINDKLYWTENYRRWHDVNVYKFLPTMVPNIDNFTIDQLKQVSRANQYAQGIGRYDDDTIYSMYKQNINDLLIFMGHNKFMFNNDEINELDFNVYAVLSGMYALDDFVWGKKENKLIHTNQVRDYLERFEIQIWGEIDGWFAYL